MLFQLRLSCFLLVSALCAVSVSAQQASSGSSQLSPNFINLDVVVTPKSSGPPLSDLQQQDFTVLDNKKPVPINSFRALNGRDTQFEIIIVVDDVNTGVEHVAFERSEIDKFFHLDGGHLAHPTALAFLTDSGMQVQDVFSTDGNQLSAALDHYEVGLHSIRRSTGIYGAAERFDLSLKALLQLADHESQRPGRKFIIWLSPGWPLLSGPGIDAQLTAKQRDEIYADAVRISTMLRQARITLYSIDPLGSSDFAGRAFRWEAYTKGLSKPYQAEGGNLALQVLAVQSGGLALTTGNDVTAFIEQCVADTHAFYELSIAPPIDDKPGTYHQLEIKVARQGTVARTRAGYYSQQQ
jgi:VWFA-related protein